MQGARRLSRWRKQKKLSQDEVAKLTGAEQPAVSRWEAGKTAPCLKFAIKLAEVSKGAVPVECWTEAVRGAA